MPRSDEDIVAWRPAPSTGDPVEPLARPRLAWMEPATPCTYQRPCSGVRRCIHDENTSSAGRADDRRARPGRHHRLRPGVLDLFVRYRPRPIQPAGSHGQRSASVGLPKALRPRRAPSPPRMPAECSIMSPPAPMASGTEAFAELQARIQQHACASDKQPRGLRLRELSSAAARVESPRRSNSATTDSSSPGRWPEVSTPASPGRGRRSTPGELVGMAAHSGIANGRASSDVDLVQAARGTSARRGRRGNRQLRTSTYPRSARAWSNDEWRTTRTGLRDSLRAWQAHLRCFRGPRQRYRSYRPRPER